MGIAMGCVQLLVGVVNLLVLLLEVAASVAISVYLYFACNDSPTSCDFSRMSIPLGFIILGILIFIVAIIGCCGICMRSSSVILTFAFLRTILLVLEVTAIVFAYIYREVVVEYFIEDFARIMRDVDKSNGFLRTLNCCRVKNATPWSDPIENPCCTWDSYTYNSFVKRTPICALSEMNCYRALLEVIEDNAVYIFIAVAIVAIIQLIGISFSYKAGCDKQRYGQ